MKINNMTIKQKRFLLTAALIIFVSLLIIQVKALPTGYIPGANGEEFIVDSNNNKIYFDVVIDPSSSAIFDNAGNKEYENFRDPSDAYINEVGNDITDGAARRWDYDIASYIFDGGVVYDPNARVLINPQPKPHIFQILFPATASTFSRSPYGSEAEILRASGRMMGMEKIALAGMTSEVALGMGAPLTVSGVQAATPYVIGGISSINTAGGEAYLWLGSKFALKAATATGISGVFWRFLWWASGNPSFGGPTLTRRISERVIKFNFGARLRYKVARLEFTRTSYLHPYIGSEATRNTWRQLITNLLKYRRPEVAQTYEKYIYPQFEMTGMLSDYEFNKLQKMAQDIIFFASREPKIIKNGADKIGTGLKFLEEIIKLYGTTKYLPPGAELPKQPPK